MTAPNITADGKSDIGKVRQANQDAFAIDTLRHIYVVADGMGGHSGGEIASWKAVERLLAFVRTTPSSNEPPDLLTRAIQAANEEVHRLAANDRKLHGMGTTLVALHLVGSTAVIGSVGDSRAYLWREGQLQQLTQDHSLVNEYVRLGTLSAEEAQSHPLKHVISRAIGIHPAVEVDRFTVAIKPDDVFLLCSDGLTNMLEPGELAQAVAQARNVPAAICAECIARANAKGGLDNITVVAVHCVSV